jgi:pyruvate formate lyase activating enzyme
VNLQACTLCPRRCAMPEGGTGFCRARGVRDGKVVLLHYGRISSISLDPIEKKPLAHYHPGATILSVGTYGCNLDCSFCQNASISRDFPPEEPERSRTVAPDELVALALKSVPQGNLGLAYTYSEPLVSYEFVRDTARAIRKAGLRNVVVTNGYLCPEPFDALLPLIDAANIDVKSFSETFYRDLCGAPVPGTRAAAVAAPEGCSSRGALACVMRNVESAVRGGVHVEVTYLVLDGENDGDEQVHQVALWLSGIRRDIPLHITRSFPRRFDFDRRPTPIATLWRLEEQARRCLDEVHVGNI